MKSATLAGNFTSSDFIRGPKDMGALVNDILSGNVILRVDTLKFPLGIVAGELKPNCSPEALDASGHHLFLGDKTMAMAHIGLF